MLNAHLDELMRRGQVESDPLMMIPGAYKARAVYDAVKPLTESSIEVNPQLYAK